MRGPRPAADRRKPGEGRRPLVLGVDPGTLVVGFALLEIRSGPPAPHERGCRRYPRLKGYGAIRLRRDQSLERRLLEIHGALKRIILRSKPSVLAVERVFHGKNFQSILKVGEARGVVLLAAAEAGIPVMEYTPAVVKKAVTGNGRAAKGQVQRMVARLLGLPGIPEPADAADALAIAFCHSRRLGRPDLKPRRRPGESPLQAFIDSIKRSRSSESRAGARRPGLERLRGTPGKGKRDGLKEKGTMTQPSQEKTIPRTAMAAGPMVLVRSELPGVKLIGRGKVRDIYDLGEHLLIVASDRLSAFDVVLPDGIPDKGKVLTRLSVFWFETLSFPNHLVTADPKRMPPALEPYGDVLADRAMLVRRLQIFPIECVARGYLSGSGWAEYKERGSICGIHLPRGLRESDRLPEPIFTPTTKAASGHDEPITFDQVAGKVGKARAEELRDQTIAVYKRAAEYALKKGIIICDTKFEWGIPPGSDPGDPKAAPAVLADEVLTPDSSRFWPLDKYKPGGSQPSFDKQYVRDYLLSLKWDKTPPGPKLPEEVIERTAAKYREIHERLTGRAWS